MTKKETKPTKTNNLSYSGNESWLEIYKRMNVAEKLSALYGHECIACNKRVSYGKFWDFYHFFLSPIHRLNLIRRWMRRKRVDAESVIMSDI